MGVRKSSQKGCGILELREIPISGGVFYYSEIIIQLCQVRVGRLRWYIEL